MRLPRLGPWQRRGRKSWPLPPLGCFGASAPRNDGTKGSEQKAVGISLLPPAAGTVRRTPGLARTRHQELHQDPVTQQDTMAVLRDVSAERGLAVLLVTHDAAMARKVSARQVVLGA